MFDFIERKRGMKFDFQSDLPLFQQVAYQLELEIFRGTYQEGDQQQRYPRVIKLIQQQY